MALISDLIVPVFNAVAGLIVVAYVSCCWRPWREYIHYPSLSYVGFPAVVVAAAVDCDVSDIATAAGVPGVSSVSGSASLACVPDCC